MIKIKRALLFPIWVILGLLAFIIWTPISVLILMPSYYVWDSYTGGSAYWTDRWWFCWPWFLASKVDVFINSQLKET